jgi:hypothetical protein
LSGLGRIVVAEAGIRFLEEGPERAIERPGSGLQQQVRAALRPLHLLRHTVATRLLAFGRAVNAVGTRMRRHTEGLIPVSQTLTCRMALASAAGTEDISSDPKDFGRRFIHQISPHFSYWLVALRLTF